MKYSLVASLALSVCVGQQIALSQQAAASRQVPRSREASFAKPPLEAQLPELAPSELTPPQHHGLPAVGVGRAVPEEMLRRGTWQTLPDGGRIWRLALRSPNAWGLRIHFTNFHVGEGRVWLYASDASGSKAPDSAAFAGPYTGDGLFQDGEFWTEPVPGRSVVIEYAPGADSASDAPRFRIDQLSHLYQTPVRPKPASLLNTIPIGPADHDISPLATTAADTATTQSCSPDVSCYSEWSAQAAAVASITFIDSGNSYICTGSLVEDSAKSGQPLFLTANHCVSDDTTARTVVAHFQYQSSTCNAGIPSYSQVPKVAGARYLVSRPIAEGDFSLMMLAAAAPAGSMYLSWSGAADPKYGDAVTAIHHPGLLPDGSAPNSKRISFGKVDYAQPANVEGEIMPAAVNVNVYWTPGQGYTEPGSSGSPLLSSAGKLIGTLTGGLEGDMISPCNPTYAVAVYGRFSAALGTLTPYLTVASTGTSSGSGSGTTPPPSTCTFSFPNGNTVMQYYGGPGSASVVASAGCTPQPSSTQAWLTVYANGNTVQFSDGWNSSPTPRAAAIKVGGVAMQLMQKGQNTVDPYSDVPATHTYADYVAALKDAGILSPCTGTSYCPDANMTRAAMATFLIRGITGSNTFPYNPTPYFADVPASSPAFSYIQRLYELGITSGCSITPMLFCPDQTVTRGQMAVFLVRSRAASPNFSYTTTPYFRDVPPTNAMFPFVQKMRDMGITAGCWTDLYCPDSGNTRGQMAVFLVRAFLSGLTF